MGLLVDASSSVGKRKEERGKRKEESVRGKGRGLIPRPV